MASMIKLFRALPSLNNKAFGLKQFAAGTPPTIHAGDQHDDDDENAYANPTKPAEVKPVIKTTPLSSPKLESTPVNNQPINPKTQRKRTNNTVTLEVVSCVGIDGFPSPGSDDGRDGRERDRKEQELDDKEYFKHHKASPLSEIEIADTRKPVTRATDSKYSSGDGGIITWLPEQLVSADETLRRAYEIFKQNAMRGDPNSPHGRRLRELRGEWW
ncbi:unnamed protein product [Rhodiola kirilowii]